MQDTEGQTREEGPPPRGETGRMWRITVWPFSGDSSDDWMLESKVSRTYVVVAKDRDTAVGVAEQRYREEMVLKHSYAMQHPIVVEQLSPFVTQTREASSVPRWWERLFR